MTELMIIAHRPARTVKFETFTDLSEALARLFDLRLAGASQLVMYDAVVLSEEEATWIPTS